jgi:di/tricarboxylate transporter
MPGKRWPTSPFQKRDLVFKRYLHRNYWTFASITHRFKRRLTLTGWVMVIGTVAAAALGADTNASISYQTFALLGCLVLASALLHAVGPAAIVVGARSAQVRIGRRDFEVSHSCPQFGRKPQNALN